MLWKQKALKTTRSLIRPHCEWDNCAEIGSALEQITIYKIYPLYALLPGGLLTPLFWEKIFPCSVCLWYLFCVRHLVHKIDFTSTYMSTVRELDVGVGGTVIESCLTFILILNSKFARLYKMALLLRQPG